MRRRLDGVLLLDKPPGVGSNAVLQTVKRLYGAEKAGHAGTLDPLASGLLPVLFGEATKFSQLALDADKAYIATARLGITTTTGDAEGEVLERKPCNVRAEDVERALAAFRGELEQVPPMYSALKHGGQPLYALARAGREARLLPLERLLGGLPRVDLPAALAERFLRGQALQVEHAPSGPCGVYGQQGRLLGLGEGRAQGELRPRRLLSYASG